MSTSARRAPSRTARANAISDPSGDRAGSLNGPDPPGRDIDQRNSLYSLGWSRERGAVGRPRETIRVRTRPVVAPLEGDRLAFPRNPERGRASLANEAAVLAVRAHDEELLGFPFQVIGGEGEPRAIRRPGQRALYRLTVGELSEVCSVAPRRVDLIRRPWFVAAHDEFLAGRSGELGCEGDPAVNGPTRR